MKRQNSRKPSRSRTLSLEPLESRVVLAGNVRAFMAGGVLQIHGDSQANEIVITQKASKFTVAPRDGSTTINGQAGPRLFHKIPRDLNISMNGGNDVVEIVGKTINPVTVRNRLYLNTGAGADQVLLTEVHGNGIHINTGSGNDVLNVGEDGTDGGLEVTKEAIIIMGSGQDKAVVTNSQFKRILNLDMGSNDDETIMLESSVKQSGFVHGGGGFDTLSREGNTGSIRYLSYNRVFNTVDAPPPVAPVASNDAAAVVRGGNTAINVIANDTSGSSALNLSSITITQQPTSGTVVANSNGTITYTNNGAAATLDTFSYTIRNQQGTISNAATVTISVNDPFAAVADAASVTEDATPNTATGNVLSNDTGGLGTRTVSAVNGSAANVGASVAGQFGTFRVNADGSFTYTLDNANATVNALAAGQTLTDTMPYSAAAGGGAAATANLVVTIQGATDPAPLAGVNDSGTVTEDATPNTTTGNVLSNDTGGAGAKTVSAVNGSAASVGTDVAGTYGTFRINADGSYTYTLNNGNATVNALNSGATLTDTMNYTASAGSETSSATLSITIEGNTDPAPLAAVNDSGSVTEDATPNTTTGNLLTNDTGGTGSKTISAVNGSAGNVATDVAGTYGTFRINADGSYTYTLNNSNATVDALNSGANLVDSMGYTASAGGETSSATLTITIHGNTDAVPVSATADTVTITEDASPNTATGNVLSNDTGGIAALTVTEVNNSAGNVGATVNGTYGTFQINADGSYTYTLDNSNSTVNDLATGSTLTDAISYTVGDGTTTASTTLTVTIEGATDA